MFCFVFNLSTVIALSAISMPNRARPGNDHPLTGLRRLRYLGHTGDGIECKSPLLTGRRLKIRYATPTTTTMTLHVNDVSQSVTFPGTGAWSGQDAYSEITVPLTIPDNAIVQLVRGPGDGAVNLDCLKGEK